MKIKIPENELDEPVTKRFLIENEFITRKTLEEILDIRFEKHSREFRQYLETLMEHQMHQLQVFMEHLDDRYVLRKEWELSRIKS